MFVQFSFDAASQQEAGALGATWIAAALEVADAEAWQTVLDGPTPVLYELLPPDQPLTSPHSYCAALTSVYESAPGSFKLRARSRALTAAGITRVVAKPAASCISVTAKILKTDDQGYPIMEPGGPGGTATVRFQGSGNSTGVLGMNFNKHDTDQVRRVLALTREYVSDVDVSFGLIRGWGDSQTAFEKAWGGGAYAQQLGPRDQLYGYGWLTILPIELAQRVQVKRLERARSVLHIVDHLPNGALWLQATSDPADYPQTAMRAVFEAVVDVLPDGRPLRPPWDDVEWVNEVVFEDASDWR